MCVRAITFYAHTVDVSAAAASRGPLSSGDSGEQGAGGQAGEPLLRGVALLGFGEGREAAGMDVRLNLGLLLLLLVGPCGGAMDECADEQSGRPQRCMPEFVNAAFNATVVATNTCGSPAEEYCVQTGVTGVTKSCHLCDASQPHLQHGAAVLTDYNNQADTTWWQSQTMLAGVQYPNTINLTLHLGEWYQPGGFGVD